MIRRCWNNTKIKALQQIVLFSSDNLQVPVREDKNSLKGELKTDSIKVKTKTASSFMCGQAINVNGAIGTRRKKCLTSVLHWNKWQ